MKDNTPTTADRLKSARVLRKLSQVEAAVIVGISVQTLRDMETGKLPINRETYRQLVKHMDDPVDRDGV